MEEYVERCRTGRGEGGECSVKVVGRFDRGQGFDTEEIWDSYIPLKKTLVDNQPNLSSEAMMGTGRFRDVQASILHLFDCRVPI